MRFKNKLIKMESDYLKRGWASIYVSNQTGWYPDPKAFVKT